MALSSKFSTRSQVKSISLPCRSHPTTTRIEQELNEAKAAATVAASKPSAETICRGLSQLIELYKCMDDLLNSSSVNVLVSRQQNKKWVEELIEESVTFLDVCGSIRDLVIEMKDHTRDIMCALRRRKGDLSVENSVTKYNFLRKKMRKDVKMLVGSLKQVDNMVTDGGSMLVDSDNQLVAVIKAIIGVSEVTVSVFESLLLLFSVPISKPNKWSIVVSKLIHKGMVACEDQQGILNEFEIIDDALQTVCKYESANQGDKMQIAKCRLERLETQLECMETRLECMFRRLIRTRASLLNIISQ
ncbi:BPS1, chloroplastic-like protein [Tanacetum coccineum]